MTDVVNVGTAANSGNGDALRDAFILVNAEFAKRGVADGYASLGSNGLVPTGQLPSYVDTVIEYATYSAFPATGASGSIYLALDTGFSYRWSGTVYVNVSGTVNSVNGQTGTVTLTASGIGSSAVGGVSATTVQAAIAELDAEKTSAATLAASGGAALVGFIQSGTGAVARTSQDKLRDAVSVKDFGAVGDGVTDDAPAIEAASLAVYNAGGGIIWVPPGTYLLGTLTSSVDARDSYITLRSGVSFVGAGVGVSVLKVKSGQNALYYSSNKPNIMSTDKAELLSNLVIRGITFDWNGANNLLDSGATRRNNASIYALYGAKNVTIEGCEFKETPGNQCIYISNANIASVPGSNLLIRNNVFRNNGSGLVGNYNTDHSSAYVFDEHYIISDNLFTATQAVLGTAYELHGSHAVGRSNHIYNYGMATYFTSDTRAETDFLVDGDYAENIDVAFSYSGSTYNVNNIRVINGTYIQAATLGTPATSPTFFVNNFFSSSDFYEIDNCRFVGENLPFIRMLKHRSIGTLKFTNNVIENFNDATNGYGIAFSYTEYPVGSGNIGDALIVDGNIFKDVYLPMYLSSATYGLKRISVRNNFVSNSTGGYTDALTVSVASCSEGGVVSENSVTGYTTAVYLGSSPAANLKNKQVVGSTTYDPISLVDGAGVTATVSARGAQLGMVASASFSLDTQGITVTAWVNSANNISVRFQNETGGTIDLASGTLRVAAQAQ